MSIRDEIIQLVNQENALAVPITDATHLYHDLHLDSLSFVSLIIDIEEQFGIKIELPEMEHCQVVGRLIELVDTKLQEDAL